MKPNKKFSIIILATLFNSISLFSQEQEKQEEKKYCCKGFGFEEGVGYNTCMSSIVGPRDVFWVQPTARIFYSVTLHNFSEKKKLKMPILVGYYTFGGKRTNIVSIPEDPISKEILLFRSLEAGINPTLELGKIQLGAIIMGQHIFSVVDRTYGDPFWRNGHSLEETDVTKKGYQNFAMEAGIKFKYKLGHFSLGGEILFGITNLYNHSQFQDGTTLTENNYRLLVSYEF